MSDSYTKLAPTQAAIDDWRAQDKPTTKPGEPSYGVDIRTRGGSWRCVTSLAEDTTGKMHGYWTIRAEGSSNEGATTWIAFDDITEARGWVVGG